LESFTFVKKIGVMTHITLRIDREDDLRQVLDLIRKLNLSIIQTKPPFTPLSNSEKEKMSNFILTFKKDRPSFGDAAEWQRRERSERELPWAV